MGEEFKGVVVSPVLYYVVYSLLIVGFTSIVSGLCGLLFGESVAYSMLFYGLVVVVGVYAFTSFASPSRPLRLDDAILVAVSSWLLVPLLAAVPVSLALDIPFIDAWFEAVSGFTTTGLSVFNGAWDPDYGVYVPSVEELPKCILLWRSLIQWIGGLGILVVFVAFAMGAGLPPHIVGLAEGRYERLEPSLAHSLRRFMQVYVLLTLAATLLFYLTGMSLFDAVNHAMTALSTGGFSTHNTSIGYYNSLGLELAVILAMVWGASNFATHYRVLIRADLLALVRDLELRLLLTLTGLLSVISTLILFFNGYSLADALRYGVFQVASVQTTTGFQTIDLADAPSSMKLVLVVSCLTGGAILSTAGGMKLYRLLVLLYSIKWSSRGSVSIRGLVIPHKVAGRSIDLAALSQVVAIAFSYLALWLIGFIVTSLFLPHTPATDVALEVASAVGTVGVSVGLTGAQRHWPYKILFMILMTLGRLEILPYMTALNVVTQRVKLLLQLRRSAESQV